MQGDKEKKCLKVPVEHKLLHQDTAIAMSAHGDMRSIKSQF